MISCTNCNTPLNSQIVNTGEMVSCPSCDGPLRADVFPALFKAMPRGTAGEAIHMDDLASCFYHQGKKAVIPCTSCGRFLCALCDIEMNGNHICPVCLEKGQNKGKLQNLENRRTCYDTIALYLAVFPAIFFLWPTILTAPMVIFMVIWFWKKPASILPRTKLRYVFAFIIAGGQVLGWSAFFFFMIRG